MSVFSRASRVHIRLCISFAQSWPPPTPPPGGYCMHFYQSAFGTRLLCLCLSNCLAKVDFTIVFCKRIVSTIRQRFAVAYMSCSLDSATLLDQKTTVGNAGAGKNCLLCMHAHTNCILFWQASYQSLLGGVLVNVCIFHERAGYTLVSCIFACSS